MRVILAVEAIGSSDCGGKFESCGELIAMDDDELQEHCILYTVILGESVHGTFISLNKLNHVTTPASPLSASSIFMIMVVGGRH